jgi:DNA-binding transcriptional LysR family regulator
MRINLPTDLLRSFVMIVDTGSMVRASEHVHLTQSALSLQMKRLADLIQQPIFRRDQGSLALTSAGEQLLVAARDILALNDGVVGTLGARIFAPIRIGMIEDFAETILSGVLKRFSRAYPGIRLQVRVGHSTELRDMFASKLLDLILHLGDPTDASSVVSTPIVWLGDSDLLLQRVLPIAVMTKPCRFRDVALAALATAGQDYAIALETPSVSVLRAAIDSGLAITCRTPVFLGTQVAPLEIASAPLPTIGYNIDVRDPGQFAIAELQVLMRAALVQLF